MGPRQRRYILKEAYRHPPSSSIKTPFCFFPICLTILWVLVLGSYTDRQLLQYSADRAVIVIQTGKSRLNWWRRGMPNAYASIRIYISSLDPAQSHMHHQFREARHHYMYTEGLGNGQYRYEEYSTNNGNGWLEHNFIIIFFILIFIPGVPYSVPGFYFMYNILAGCRESNPSCKFFFLFYNLPLPGVLPLSYTHP